MLVVELVVVVVRQFGAQKLQVWLADDKGSCLVQQTGDACLLIHFVGVLASLVVVAETAYLQAMQTLDILDVEIEVTCHIRGEVVFRHLEEQLVLVYGIRNIGQEEHELVVAFVAKALVLGRIVVVDNVASHRPYIAQVELASVESLAGVDSIHYHTRHLAESAVRIFLHHGVHDGHT